MVRRRGLILGLIAAVLFFECCVPTLSCGARMEQARPYLGADVKVVLCYDLLQQQAADAAMVQVWQRFADIHAQMNFFDPASDIGLLNASSGRELKVHDDVHVLMAELKEYARLTSGAFDVTVGPLTAIWKRAAEKDVLPSPDQVRDAKRLVGADRIRLADGGRVEIPSGMKVDLGGGAAGFAADEAVRLLRKAGFNDFLVDAGGEIYAAGQSCEGRPWRVGISDPLERGSVLDVLQLRDQAVSTSGGYERYFEINGERYSHIIDPVTGYPQHGVVSATVVARHALDADVLSTALCVLGPEEGFRLIASLGEGYAAMVMLDDRSEIDHVNALERRSTPGYADLKVK